MSDLRRLRARRAKIQSKVASLVALMDIADMEIADAEDVLLGLLSVDP